MTLQKASSMHHNRKENKVSTNIEMLYIMNIVQLVLPLITLPYLTRVLSVDGYGVVSYVKSLIIYITLIIEFGYLLSGTREVAEANNKRQLGVIIGKITVAKLILSSLAFLTLLLLKIPPSALFPLFYSTKIVPVCLPSKVFKCCPFC